MKHSLRLLWGICCKKKSLLFVHSFQDWHLTARDVAGECGETVNVRKREATSGIGLSGVTIYTVDIECQGFVTQSKYQTLTFLYYIVE